MPASEITLCSAHWPRSSQQYHELYYDRLKMFMQQLKLDQNQAAPESKKQTAAATLPQMFAAQKLQSEMSP